MSLVEPEDVFDVDKELELIVEVVVKVSEDLFDVVVDVVDLFDVGVVVVSVVEAVIKFDVEVELGISVYIYLPKYLHY